MRVSFWKVATIVAYLKEVESPYAVLDFIRSYLGDTVDAKEFAKQFLERRAKQKANQQRQQQQVGLSLLITFVSHRPFKLFPTPVHVMSRSCRPVEWMSSE